MLTIRQAMVDAMVAHARADHPDEACGVIAGPTGSDRPERFIPMVNAARSPTFYEFDSMDLLRLYREMDDNDEVPVVVYHSHTATEAYPSRTDVTYAVGARGPLRPGLDARDRQRGRPLRAALLPDRRRHGHGGGGQSPRLSGPSRAVRCGRSPASGERTGYAAGHPPRSPWE